MNLTVSQQGSIAKITLTGRFDAHEVPAVKAWFADSAESSHLLVNLQGVHFIDSTALSTLVQGMKRCREKGGDLVLCNLQQPVRVIFELTRLDRAFSIYSTEADAVNALQN